MICNGIRIIWVWKNLVVQVLLYTMSYQMHVVVYEFVYFLQPYLRVETIEL